MKARMEKEKFEEFKELCEEIDCKVKGFNIVFLEDFGTQYRIHFEKDDGKA